MSLTLVSYGASDESDSSDVEDSPVSSVSSLVTAPNTQSSTKTSVPNISVTSDHISVTSGHIIVTSGHISDEEDWVSSNTSVNTVGSNGVGSTSVNSDSAMSWDAIKSAQTTSVSGNQLNPGMGSADDTVNSTSITSLDDLPAPQSRLHVLDTAEEELEDEVKPKASEINNAPKPPSKKSRQPIRITIPSLTEEPAEEEDKKKKSAPSTVKSSLFSMLPAPVNSVKKEVNRPLIPYTLTKKSAPPSASGGNSGHKQASSSILTNKTVAASSTEVSSKRINQFNALTGYDSDSDDEDDGGGNIGKPTNFFSLSSSDTITATSSSVAGKQRLQSEEVSSSESEETSATKVQRVVAESGGSGADIDDDVVEPEAEMGPEPAAVNDAPLDFRSLSHHSAWSSSSSYGFLAPVGLQGPISQNFAGLSSQVSSTSLSADYRNTAVFSQEVETVPDDDLKQLMSDREFQKLQGKRKRGLEEAVSFVDANVDDYVDPTEVNKYLTEETDYVSHKSKEQLPTAQQRRKKQITYLAFQAKERELELKNAWAQNRMTKKQTQSKYGF